MVQAAEEVRDPQPGAANSIHHRLTCRPASLQGGDLPLSRADQSWHRRRMAGIQQIMCLLTDALGVLSRSTNPNKGP